MFIAHLKQAGEGCDYSIACGEKLLELEAQTQNEAIAELEQMCCGTPGRLWDDFYWDATIESIVLYEVSSREELPVEQWYTETEIAKHQYLNKEQEKAARAKYEELKVRFEGDEII